MWMKRRLYTSFKENDMCSKAIDAFVSRSRPTYPLCDPKYQDQIIKFVICYKVVYQCFSSGCHASKWGITASNGTSYQRAYSCELYARCVLTLTFVIDLEVSAQILTLLILLSFKYCFQISDYKFSLVKKYLTPILNCKDEKTKCAY